MNYVLTSVNASTATITVILVDIYKLTQAEEESRPKMQTGVAARELPAPSEHFFGQSNCKVIS